MAADSFTNTNGTVLTSHDARWKFASGQGEILSNAARVSNGFAQAWCRWEDGQGQFQDAQVKFLAGDWTDGTRSLWINGPTDKNDGYELRVSSSWVSLYRVASVKIFQQAHGISNIATNGVTARVYQDSGGVIRVSLDGGAYTTSWTDGSPLTTGYTGVAVDIGANNRDQYTWDDWVDSSSGGAAPVELDLLQSRRRIWQVPVRVVVT